MITAIIFDMDGVVIESQTALDEFEFDFLSKLTHNQWTLEEQQSIHGLSLDDVYRKLFNEYELRVSRQSFLGEYDELLSEVYTNRCYLTPGVEDFISQVYPQNYRLALASSTSRKFINVVLDRFNLRKFFQVVVSADDVMGKGKPEPDIFLLTAHLLSVDPIECIVIEDSPNGIKAAKRAGMYCIRYDKEEREQSFADHVITNFSTFSLADALLVIENDRKQELVTITQDRRRFYLQLNEMVNKSDYYSDFLLHELIALIKLKKNQSLDLLEVGTGRGYISIILAMLSPNIRKIVAVDIDDHAVSLSKKNVWLNNAESKIEIRKGNLYSALKKGEHFDIIFGALPQLPVTKKGLLQLKVNLPSYHFNTSAGGADGLFFLKKFISDSPKYLKKQGIIAEVQSDFSNPHLSLQYMLSAGLKPLKIKKKKKLLKETSLTKALSRNMAKDGYAFRTSSGHRFFYLLFISAVKKD